jgi:hypothetical protein
LTEKVTLEDQEFTRTPTESAAMIRERIIFAAVITGLVFTIPCGSGEDNNPVHR